MEVFTWNSNLSVGVYFIDNQHKQLIEMINQFAESAIQRKDKNENLKLIIKGPKEYAIFHFNHEERLMKNHNFPNYISHKEEHDVFISRVNELEHRFIEGKLVVTVEIIVFIQEWLTSHINGTDRLYSDFFRENGVN